MGVTRTSLWDITQKESGVIKYVGSDVGDRQPWWRLHWSGAPDYALPHILAGVVIWLPAQRWRVHRVCDQATLSEALAAINHEEREDGCAASQRSRASDVHCWRITASDGRQALVAVSDRWI